MPAPIAAIEWPAECATCGVSLQHARPPDAPDAESDAHPFYCSTCLDAHAKHGARARAFGAGAVLAGVSAALAFPLIEPHAGLGWHLLAAGALALLPIAGLGAARPLAGWGSAPRVHGLGPLGTCVERRELAERLGREGRSARSLGLPPLVYRPGWSLIVFIALGLCLVTSAWHHPRVWVINLTRERLWLAVDGGLRAAIDPAGSEPARGALELRLPRGERLLEAFDERHQRVASVRAVLEGGRDHVYAPRSDDSCFWLESTGYGRDATHQIRPLLSGARFFALDTDVDTWFSPPPAPPRFDRRSSGGTLTALRQSPCARAPESVRQASSAVGP